jgi:AraC-like ligand binding domain
MEPQAAQDLVDHAPLVVQGEPNQPQRIGGGRRDRGPVVGIVVGAEQLLGEDAHGRVVAVPPAGGSAHRGHAAERGGFTYAMLHLGTDLVADILADAPGGRVSLPLLTEPVVDDGPLAARLRRLDALLLDGATRLEAQELVMGAVLAMVQRHASQPVAAPMRRSPRPPSRPGSPTRATSRAGSGGPTESPRASTGRAGASRRLATAPSACNVDTVSCRLNLMAGGSWRCREVG